MRGVKSLPIILVVVSLAVLTFDGVSNASEGAQFPDVPSDHTNAPAIYWLADEGIIQGYPDGTFQPNGAVNRAEIMKMIVMMKAAVDDNYQNCFPDVFDEWFARYVCFGKAQNWIEGYPDGIFRPANNVNRVEAMKIILSALVEDEDWAKTIYDSDAIIIPADIDLNAWYEPYARFALENDLLDKQHVTRNIDGTENYYPSDNMTRKEVAEMIYRIHIR